ncbi:MAG: PIN domain-containing protein [Thermoleophilia bacterium]
MTAVFVDTNVLVYARDASHPEKQARAMQWLEALWRTRAGRVGYQVLHEYYSVVTQRLQPGLDRGTARADVRRLLLWEPLPLDQRVAEGAWAIQDRFQCSWRDALIVSAARVSGCGYLLSEDLQHEAQLGSVRVIDPFRSLPEDIVV